METAYATWRLTLVSAEPASVEQKRSWLADYLKDAGYKIQVRSEPTLSRALHAIAHTTDYRPDAILWDAHSAPVDDLAIALRESHWEIPVIVFTIPDDPDEFSQVINFRPSAYVPLAADVDADRMQDSIVRVVKAITSYTTWKTHSESSIVDGTVLKTDTIDSGLKNQIEFLQYANRNSTLRHYFPKPRNILPTETTISYEMDYYRLPSLKKILLNQSDAGPCKEIVRDSLRAVLDIAFDEIFPIQQLGPPPPGFLYEVCTKKVRERFAQSKAIIARKHGRQSASDKRAQTLYLDIVGGKSLVYGNESVGNPLKLLEMLDASGVYQIVHPKRLCLIHGDLHFDNILIRLYPEPIKVMFLDPRGFQFESAELGVYDPAYDLGKLLHSAAGEYDLITSGFRSINVDACRRLAKYVQIPMITSSDRTVHQRGGGASTAATTIYRRPMKDWMLKVYEEAAQFIHGYVVHRQSQFGDDQLANRAALFSACHLLSTGPSHLDKDPVTALTLLVKGTVALRKYCDQQTILPS